MFGAYFSEAIVGGAIDTGANVAGAIVGGAIVAGAYVVSPSNLCAHSNVNYWIPFQEGPLHPLKHVP